MSCDTHTATVNEFRLALDLALGPVSRPHAHTQPRAALRLAGTREPFLICDLSTVHTCTCIIYKTRSIVRLLCLARAARGRAETGACRCRVLAAGFG